MRFYYGHSSGATSETTRSGVSYGWGIQGLRVLGFLIVISWPLGLPIGGWTWVVWSCYLIVLLVLRDIVRGRHK